MTIWYIDYEFDGHNGQNISMAMVSEQKELYLVATDLFIKDEWVKQNVIPILHSDSCLNTFETQTIHFGSYIRFYIKSGDLIIADSPVDISRFCRDISTDPSGNWNSLNLENIKFEVRNVNCYPSVLSGAIQHNAWWDASALRARVDNMMDNNVAIR